MLPYLASSTVGQTVEALTHSNICPPALKCELQRDSHQIDCDWYLEDWINDEH